MKFLMATTGAAVAYLIYATVQTGQVFPVIAAGLLTVAVIRVKGQR